MSINAAVGWLSDFEDLMAVIAPRFGRVEPPRQARSYLLGLLSPLADKNGWTLAEAAGDRTPDKMQRLLNAARWDAHAVRDDLRSYVAARVGDPDGVLIEVRRLLAHLITVIRSVDHIDRWSWCAVDTSTEPNQPLPAKTCPPESAAGVLDEGPGTQTPPPKGPRLWLPAGVSRWHGAHLSEGIGGAHALVMEKT